MDRGQLFLDTPATANVEAAAARAPSEKFRPASTDAFTNQPKHKAPINPNRLANLRPRQKGQQNKITTTLKEAILRAAELTGSDGKGKDELVGYLRTIAKVEPVAFCSLLGKVLPLTIAGDKNNPLVHHVKLTLVRSEKSMAGDAAKVVGGKLLEQKR